MVPRRRFHAPEPEPLDLERALAGRLRVETRRDGAWNVQPQSASSAVKVYVCPGCGGDIEVGTAHVVTWRADGIMGADDDLAGRRHWHAHCWRIRT
ncbi:hypothetical protein GCM10009840_16950 [Pseudolysinimonas kribbensis]|uniref:ATP/GTP-binding protein n=1 Tax=Pseudolysinimonas kribbensis TaxID=433641 RepID=A0ABQ6K3R1_9MICO|nr:hypothetical protein GCM10025881_07580 [Pseudolysinimonas kribbensis]